MSAAAPPARGRFITVEGGEGSGKSTQIARLAAALAHAGVAVKATREPGGSDGAEAIRRLLLEGDSERWDGLSEALLFAAARRDHVIRTIEPALNAGIWVVCDRFADSTLAYQGFGKGLARGDLLALQRLTIGAFMPDLTLILDLPVEEGLRRAASRAGRADRFERLGRDFHERLRAGFRRIAEGDPKRCRLIEAAGDVDTVHRRILAAVAERFGADVAGG